MFLDVFYRKIIASVTLTKGKGTLKTIKRKIWKSIKINYKTNIQNAVRIYWQTEAWNGEYDIPACPEGTPRESCIHTLTSTFKASDLFSNCDIVYDGDCSDIEAVKRNNNEFELIYAGGHVHVGGISIELINFLISFFLLFKSITR